MGLYLDSEHHELKWDCAILYLLVVKKIVAGNSQTAGAHNSCDVTVQCSAGKNRPATLSTFFWSNPVDSYITSPGKLKKASFLVVLLNCIF
jgi:hypothetical protein